MTDNNIPIGLPSALHMVDATRQLAQEAAKQGLLTDDVGIATVRDAQAHLSNAAVPHLLIEVATYLGEIAEHLAEANRISRAGLALHAYLSGYLSDRLDQAVVTHITALVAETVTPAPKSEESPK
ncbi:hypothetical protein [Nocardia niigatensis]